MNRTNLSPATSAIVLRLLTAEVIRTEEAHRVAGEAFGAADAAHGRVANQRGKLADARYDARQKALGATQAAAMPPMVIDLDPWQDIGDGIAIRRERGRVVEVRVAGASLSPSIVYSLGAVDEKRGGGVLCMVGAWEQIGEAWYIRVREQSA